MSVILRRKGVMLVSTTIILLLMIDYFFKIPGLSTVVTSIQGWGIVIAGFAFLLGACYISRVHINNLFKLRPMRGRVVSRWYSAVLLVSLFSFVIVALLKGPKSSEYLWMYGNLLSPLGSTTYSLTIFWLISASYRAFRVRNIESAVLLACAFISLLGFIPVGAVIWSGFPDLLAWIIEIQTGASRAIVICAGLGTFALVLRTITGKEKISLGITDEGEEAG